MRVASIAAVVSALTVSCADSRGTITVNDAASDAWWQYLAEYDGAPGSTIVNLGLKSRAPRAEYPCLVVVGLSYESPEGAAGLPPVDSLDELTRLSNDRLDTLRRTVRAVHVGTFSHQRERLDYIYVADSAGVAAALAEWHARVAPSRTQYLNVKSDPNWDAYFAFLYPNAQIMRLHRAALQKLGVTGP